MLNSLKIATDGYLKRTTKAVLIIAVSGYLNYTVIPTSDAPVSTMTGSDGMLLYYQDQVINRIKKEDEELLVILRIFLACQN